jgi:hypothetical protein
MANNEGANIGLIALGLFALAALIKAGRAAKETSALRHPPR